MFDEATRRAVATIAARMQVDTNVLLAVAHVESAGKVFADVNGRREPVIRWEGHYFDRRLKNGKQAKARAAGLASPKAGVVKNPKGQQERWTKLYLPASRIDARAAFESVSWGLGQVMGAHWQALGFGSPVEMLAMARSGAAGQIEIMARYIEKFGLVDELQRLDFRAFTRGYNGPGGISAGYHKAMEQAYQRLTGKVAVSAATGMLRMGAKGAAVREIQAILVRAGYPLKVDGDYGPSTRDAVKAFQKASGITVDGVVGPETQAALSRVPRFNGETPGEIGVTETPEAKEGLGGLVGAGGVEVARQQVENASDKLSYVPGLEWLSAILAVIAVMLVLGSLAWIGWGWLKARRTETGDEDVVAVESLSFDLEEALS